MTKHEPAMPLPYMAENYAVKYVDHGQWLTIARTNEHRFTEAARIQTATYLAHAANAYPRLVEELLWTASQDPNRVTAAGNRARSMLRELGEIDS